MRAIAKTYSPEVRQWAAKLRRRQAPGVNLRACHGLLRRLAWTGTFLARFAPIRLPASGAQRTLLQGTWQRFGRSQWFSPQVQLCLQTSLQATWQGRDRIHVPPAAPAVLAHTTFLRTVVEREYRSQSGTLWRTNSLRWSTQNFRETTRHSLTTVMAGHTQSAAMPRFSTVASTAMRRWSIERDLEQSAIVRRVLHQTQRIEEPILSRPETVLLRRAALLVPGRTFSEASAPPQVRPASMNAPWQGTTAQPQFSIHQITDEVVRQLDSRLVAARERFGKI